MAPISHAKEPQLKCGAPETHSSGQLLVANASLAVHPSQEPSHPIFLSHSGAQKQFVEQLYHEFENEGHYPFFDREHHSLEIGKEFPTRIIQAAKECQVAIIILTEQFLSSKWPMLELLTFVDAQKELNREMHLFPVLFNDLKVEDLHEHFWREKWKKLVKLDSESKHPSRLTLEKCAEALQILRKVNMLDIKNYNGSHYRLCKAIVKSALRLLPQDSDSGTKDIQGAGRLCEILLRLFQDSSIHSNGVKYLGLYGMGGLGKTTMCKALCSHFSSEFGSKVFHVELGGHNEEHRLDRLKKLLQKLTPFATKKNQDLSANEVINAGPYQRSYRCAKAGIEGDLTLTFSVRPKALEQPSQDLSSIATKISSMETRIISLIENKMSSLEKKIVAVEKRMSVLESHTAPTMKAIETIGTAVDTCVCNSIDVCRGDLTLVMDAIIKCVNKNGSTIASDIGEVSQKVANISNYTTPNDDCENINIHDDEVVVITSSNPNDTTCKVRLEDLMPIMDGKTIDRLKKRLKGIPVFLAVDNVQDDEASRQEARNILEYISCPGSKVLITSRSQDIVYSVLQDVSCCKPIPNLNEMEAMDLFLKIAAPRIESTSSLNVEEIEVLRECLKCCYFMSEESVTQNTVNNTTSGNRSIGHYHPLALRSVASFLQDRYVDKSSILNWKKNLEDPSLMLYHSRESKDIFNILGLDFDLLCEMGKQLFLDVAVFASTETISDPRQVFNYLLKIHGKSERDCIDAKLSELRRKSFLSYDQHTGIATHDLYREFGQRYLVNSGNNEIGIYVEKSNFKGGTNWSVARRVLLRACKTHLPEMQPWSNVVVVHLVQCKHIHNFFIGEMRNLRHLLIYDCLQLEVLSWTPGDCSENQPVYKSLQTEWGLELRLIQLAANSSLKTLPDFSICSKLELIEVKRCGRLVNPFILRSCSKLTAVVFMGENTHVQIILESCSKLCEAQLTWRTGGGMPKLKNLPALWKLQVRGAPSKAEELQEHITSKRPQEEILANFLSKYPAETEEQDIPEVATIKNLKELYLEHLPLGKLPGGLNVLGVTLRILSLRGSLLSQLVDFSPLSNLQKLDIAWTNVKKVCGLGRLSEFEFLDCSFCFQLETILDLQRASKLKSFFVLCCRKLKQIPRLPPEYCKDGEEWKSRFGLALSTGQIEGDLNIPPPGLFAFRPKISDLQITRCSNFQPAHLAKEHSTIQCDGCLQMPLVGPRFTLKRHLTRFCKGCFTINCTHDKSTLAVQWNPFNYNLCLTCFKEWPCDPKDFLCIYETRAPSKGSLGH